MYFNCFSLAGGRVLPAKWILVFILWTVASFACHHQGKVFLQQASAILNVDERTDDLVLGILALALSAAQLTICVLLTSLETSTPSKDLNVETIEKTFASYYVAIAGHVMTTVLTNWSLARMEAASTLAVKLTEPIVSAMVQRMWMGQRLSVTTWWSLMVVVDGALLFTSDGAGIQQIVTMGVVLAMMSNVVLAARNLALKRLYGGDFRVTLVPWNRVVMVILALVLGIFFLQLLEVEGRVTKGRTTTFFAMVLSGLFHVCYSVVSTGVVLRALDVVSHALANICKRVLVVMLLYVFGTRRGTMTNGFGLGLAIFGLLLYVRETIRSRRNVTDDTKVACTERLKGK